MAEGDTRLSIFETSSDNSFPSCLILSDVLWIISLLLADGLLVCIIDAYHFYDNAHGEEDLEMFSRLCRVLVSNSAVISLRIRIR